MRSIAFRSSASKAPPTGAVRAVFTVDRISLRTARLRRRRFSFCLIRFFAERVLATVNVLP